MPFTRDCFVKLGRRSASFWDFDEDLADKKCSARVQPLRGFPRDCFRSRHQRSCPSGRRISTFRSQEIRSLRQPNLSHLRGEVESRALWNLAFIPISGHDDGSPAAYGLVFSSALLCRVCLNLESKFSILWLPTMSSTGCGPPMANVFIGAVSQSSFNNFSYSFHSPRR